MANILKIPNGFVVWLITKEATKINQENLFVSQDVNTGPIPT